MKNLTTYLCFVILLFSFTTCSDNSNNDENCDGWIWDFFNYEILISATDSETGSNLFDPQTENNLLGEDGVWITYKNKTFNIVDWNYPENGTRATYVRPLALRYYPANENSSVHKKLLLGFGEFSPTSDYRNETFTIHWADGTSDEVKLDCYITWDECAPTVHRALYLNGDEISDKDYPELSFVKEGKK